MLTIATLLGPSPLPVPPRRGRRRVAELPAERQRHIECAISRIFHGTPAKKLMRRFDVSERTIRGWVKLALSYDCPESEALRRRAGC